MLEDMPLPGEPETRKHAEHHGWQSRDGRFARCIKSAVTSATRAPEGSKNRPPDQLDRAAVRY